MIKPFFKIKTEKEEKNYAKFIFEPLQPGFGHTLGTALRRTLLGGLKGAAVSSIRIDNVTHPFSTIKGMKEDVVELILNIKQLKIAYKGDKELVLKLNAKGIKTVKAKDIELPAGVKIVNKDLVLADLTDKNTKLKIEMIINTGVGYQLAKDKKTTTLGVIPVDSAYSPITRVNYKIEATRVGRRADFDKLILEIYTNGTVKCREAIDRAAKLLVDFFKQVYQPVFEKETVQEEEISVKDNETLELTLEEVNLPTRIVNALRKAGYKTVGDLVHEKSEKIMDVKNLGKKSISVIKESLKKKGINLSDEA